MRFMIIAIMSLIGMMAHAKSPDVVYLEKVGNGSTRVFAVKAPVKEMKVFGQGEEEKLKPEEIACRTLLAAILFDGVENYNLGNPLVADANNAYAQSILSPKKRSFKTFCKSVELENSPTNKTAYHYIIELNHFNLLRLLKMRGALTTEFEE